MEPEIKAVITIIQGEGDQLQIGLEFFPPLDETNPSVEPPNAHQCAMQMIQLMQKFMRDQAAVGPQ